MSNLIKKLEQSIESLKNKKARVFFFVQDTKGNARASIRYIYQMAMSLKDAGYEAIILHEKPDYFGVQDWLSGDYMSKLRHIAVEGQNLEVSPEDAIVVPELYGYVMGQLANLPCAKIVLCQSYDYIFETLQPGQTWVQFGFTKCITTSEKMKEHISQTMRGVSVDVIEPIISDCFKPSKYPVKPVIAIHAREQRDSINLIKSFYVKYPQYRWISFRDMRGVSESEFANNLRECMLSVWIDERSSFGTFPLESMASGIPVMAKVPNLIPNWVDNNNGLWVDDTMKLQDYNAEFIQNWLEDNVSDIITNSGIETSKKFSDSELFGKNVIEKFEGYNSVRLNLFQEEYNKQLETQNV
jgi:hypothetical protein